MASQQPSSMAIGNEIKLIAASVIGITVLSFGAVGIWMAFAPTSSPPPQILHLIIKPSKPLPIGVLDTVGRTVMIQLGTIPQVKELQFHIHPDHMDVFALISAKSDATAVSQEMDERVAKLLPKSPPYELLPAMLLKLDKMPRPPKSKDVLVRNYP